MTLYEAILAHVARTLEECDGNVTEAARRLGVARTTVQRHMRAIQERRRESA